MEIEFKTIFNACELKTMSAEDILKKLQDSMEYDEEQWRSLNPVRHKSPNRARHIELALYMCSNCGRVGAMRSFFNRLHCKACGHVLKLSKNHKFMALGQSKPRFESIRAWNKWQEKAFRQLLENSAPDYPLFSDSGVKLLKGSRIKPLFPLHSGTLVLYGDRIELTSLAGHKLAFYISHIEGEGVLKQQLLEFYIEKTLYQLRFPRRFQSARKWADAISILKPAAAR